MSNGQSILKTSLLDLLFELRDEDIPFVLGGGYGLYLKQVHLQDMLGVVTVIGGELWPQPRATEDLDILLRTEVVIDAERMRSIRAALDRLDYIPVAGAEYMQFAKSLGRGRDVKVDILTGPLGSMSDDPRVKVGARRIRPRPSVKLHAHRTDEALGFQDDAIEIIVDGVRSCGTPYQAAIQVPSAFTLLLMKLHAFRDRCQDTNKDLGRHHALDIYRIVAMMTEQEFEYARNRIAAEQEQPAVVDAREIVAEHFRTATTLGAIRLREHVLWQSEMALADFLLTLDELFAS